MSSEAQKIMDGNTKKIFKEHLLKSRIDLLEKKSRNLFLVFLSLFIFIFKTNQNTIDVEKYA